MARSSKGQFRSGGIIGKIRWDILPPRGQKKVSETVTWCGLAGFIGTVIAPGPGTILGGIGGYAAQKCKCHLTNR